MLEQMHPIESVEQDLDPLIAGYVDPVDDVLECYGTQEFHRRIQALDSDGPAGGAVGT